MQRTIASSAPEYANHEQDVVKQSFCTGNHTWMKEALPVELAPDSVNQLRRQRMERNRLAEPLPQTWSKMTQLWGGGCYQEFEYIPDNYGRRAEIMKKSRVDATELREKISHHDWKHTSQEKRMKHETLINDPRNKDPYPYLGGDKDEELHPGGDGSWLRNGSNMGAICGNMTSSTFIKDRSLGTESSFLAGRGGGLEDDSRGSRMTLPLVVQRMQKRLEADWEGTTVVVNATDQDLVQISFNLGTVDSERGVAAYMNVLSKDPELLGSLGLRKVSQLWGMRRDFSGELGDSEEGKTTWIFYLLTPKWVHMRPTDAYYTTHPRSKGSAFRMSTAGSSVLMSLGSATSDPATARKKGIMPQSGGLDLLAQAQGSVSARGPGPEQRIALGAIERALHERRSLEAA